MDRLDQMISLRSFMYGCPEDELRLRFYSNQDDAFIDAVVHFSSRKITTKGGSLKADHPLFILSVEREFHAISFPLIDPPKSLADAQVAEIKQQLAAMPKGTDETGLLDYSQNECYVAFHQGGKLRVEAFLPGAAPGQLKSICLNIGFSPVFAYWNSHGVP